MNPFKAFSGIAAPLLIDDINTDQMSVASAPVGVPYGDLLFARWRARPDFILNEPPYNKASILVAGQNFGSGSSRETAVWALVGFGFRCVVARSFADIFRENCIKNGLLPVCLADADADRFERRVVDLAGGETISVDLEGQVISCPGLGALNFQISPAEKTALLTGLDDIQLSLESADSITRWETDMRSRRPWLQGIETEKMT